MAGDYVTEQCEIVRDCVLRRKQHRAWGFGVADNTESCVATGDTATPGSPKPIGRFAVAGGMPRRSWWDGLS